MEVMFYRDALSSAIVDEMERDPKVFIFGLDVPDHKKIFGSTKGILERFGPKRCFGTPLSEDAMTGVALGAAISGLRPVHVHIRTDFLLLGMNQIANMVSNIHYLTDGKLKVPLTIRAVIGRGWGQGAQHSKTLHCYFAHIPGLKVIMPTTPQDAYSLTRAAIQDDNPVLSIEHRWLYDIQSPVEKMKPDSLGKALVRRKGEHVSLISVSWMTVEALQAAEILSRSGVHCEVVDVRSIYPLDSETINLSVQKTGRALVLDYDWTYCGFSAEVAADIQRECFTHLKGPVERLGFAHSPCPTTRVLENEYYPNAETIVRTVERMLKLDSTDLSNDNFYTYENKFKGPF